jgi:DNA-binding NarL/FixJ family response regulator
MRGVLVVEDDASLREDLVFLINHGGSSFRVVEAAGTAAEALQKAPDRAIEVALVDLGLPDRPGVELIERLVALRPGLTVVALTLFDDAPTVLAAMRAGAQGYLLKSTPPGRLLEALREACEGGSPLTASVARVLVEALRSPGGDEVIAPLSEQERRVLSLLALGHTYADTARALGIGLGTVQGYVKVLYGKLGVASKAEAARAARRLGLA